MPSSVIPTLALSNNAGVRLKPRNQCARVNTTESIEMASTTESKEMVNITKEVRVDT